MISVISPAKSLDFETRPVTDRFSQPDFLGEATVINAVLKKLQPADLAGLMQISDKLAELNALRNQVWLPPFTPANAKQAVLAFDGDVYDGMQAATFSDDDFAFAQQHLRILSGLYGVLRPLDLIQPYRLEMGTRLPVGASKDLYRFWNEKITARINNEVAANGGTLVNLASNEYFKAIDLKKFNGEIITPEFKDLKDGNYKIISFFAKKARGLMSRFIIKNRITNTEDLKAFDAEGYYFNPRLSKDTNWVFTREK